MPSESLLPPLLIVACVLLAILCLLVLALLVRRPAELLKDMLPVGAWHASRKLREDADEQA